MRLTVFAICAICAIPLSAYADADASDKGNKVPSAAMKAAAVPKMWEGLRTVTAPEMTYSPGSEAGAPKPFPNGTFHFVREEIKATFPKIEIKDALGRKYKVKFGNGNDSKSHSEIANNRLLWAVGFRAREIYYVASGKLDGFTPGDPKNPGKHSRLAGRLKKDTDGFYPFADVSFTAKEDDAIAEDSWGYEDHNLPDSISKNPQFTWLKIFDVLVGNWDTGRDNHAIYYVKNLSGQFDAWYQDKDVGTGFGKDHEGAWLFRIRPTRWKLSDYQKGKFVMWDNGRPKQEVKGEQIHFDFATSKTMPHASEVQEACSTVSKADAKAFVEQVLNRIPEAAIREAFRTSGATPQEVDGYTGAFLGKVQELRIASGALR